jgi:glucosamine-phosphate N-acetyltransferase
MLEYKTNASGKDTVYELEVFDTEQDYLVVGYGKVIVDRKREGRPAGLIEDIWVHENYRKTGIGKNIMENLIELAKKRDCYKVVLICAEHNIGFYEKCGFHLHQHGMRINL